MQWLRRAINQMGPGVKRLTQRLSGYQPVPAYDSPHHPDWRLMKAILERWLAELRTPVVICPIPLYQHIEEMASPGGYRARFDEFHRPPDVLVHDPLPDFQQVAPRGAARLSLRGRRAT